MPQTTPRPGEFNPPNKSTHDPNSWFDPTGKLRPPTASHQDPNSWFRTMPVKADVNLNTAPAGSAVEKYYERMMGLMPTGRQAGLADLGSVLGSFAGDQRTNRVVQGNFQGDFDRTMLEREAAKNQIGLESQSNFDRMKLLAGADKRDSVDHAMQNIQLGAHLQRGDRVTDAKTRGVSYTPSSDQEQAAARGLIDQMHGQLSRPEFEPTKFEGDFSYQPTDPSKYMKPGLMEKIGSYGGAITGGLGALDMLTGGRSGDYINKLMGRIPGVGGLFGKGGETVMNAAGIPVLKSTIGGGVPLPPGVGNAGGLMSNLMGKALPVAGIAAGSYGLIKNRGLGTNMMNGAQVGAGIGSIVPGLGTLVGAGIGAGVGGLRTLFGGGPKKPVNPLVQSKTPEQLAALRGQ